MSLTDPCIHLRPMGSCELCALPGQSKPFQSTDLELMNQRVRELAEKCRSDEQNELIALRTKLAAWEPVIRHAMQHAELGESSPEIVMALLRERDELAEKNVELRKRADDRSGVIFWAAVAEEQKRELAELSQEGARVTADRDAAHAELAKVDAALAASPRRLHVERDVVTYSGRDSTLAVHDGSGPGIRAAMVQAFEQLDGEDGG